MSQSDVAPDYVAADDPDADPVELLVPKPAQAGNTLRLLDRLRRCGYAVDKQHTTEHQTVYAVYPEGGDA